jgi:hypothetical protein
MKYIILINACRQENSKLDIQLYCDDEKVPTIFQTYQEAQAFCEKNKLKGHIAELPDSFTRDEAMCVKPM